MKDQVVNEIVVYESISFFNLVAESDWVISIIYLLLLGASIWTWAIIFEKTVLLRSLKVRIKKFEGEFWSGKSLEELFKKIGTKPKDPMSALFASAFKEWQKSSLDQSNIFSQNQRVEQVMRVTLDREITEIENRMTFLSSTGSVAPFLGLFGTVWGIINAFHQIGITGNTSITVIAPGIGEALYTTAFGLVVAIPAVLAYNNISSDVDKLARRLENFAVELSAILSKQSEKMAENKEER